MNANEATNQEEEGEGEKVVESAPGGGASLIHVKVRAIAVSGYWSTGCYMEKLIGKYRGEEEENDVLEAVDGAPWSHASYKYLFHKREVYHEELDD